MTNYDNMGDNQKDAGVLRMTTGSADSVQIPKGILTAMNELYEIEQKVKKHNDPVNCMRNVSRMKGAFEELGLVYEDPMGQIFKDTRTDLVASIAGAATESLAVVEVIKPIIRVLPRDGTHEFSRVIQKGIVVVASQKEH